MLSLKPKATFSRTSSSRRRIRLGFVGQRSAVLAWLHFAAASLLRPMRLWFEIFQAGRVAQRVEGKVQHVVALVVRQMNLQQVQSTVDGVGQFQFAHQQQH